MMNTNKSVPDSDALTLLFPEITRNASPSDSITALLTHIGEIFQCERVYLFEKDENGSYDCTYEWYDDQTTFSKKHLMQNLTPQAVRHYYQYFNQKKPLLVRTLDELKQTDDALYRILLPQDLESLLCSQLIYDNRDLGFVGIDNPSRERFQELENVFGAIVYYLSLQIHQTQTFSKLEKSIEPYETYSLYDRLSLVSRGDSLAVLYCSVSPKFQPSTPDDPIYDKVRHHAENVLGSIFERKNIFHIEGNEFLVFFADNEEMDISSIHHYMALAKTTLIQIGIIICMGSAVTSSYDGSFFELVQMANSRLLREKKKYRERYLGKYHLEHSEAPYQDLIEIYPSENKYRVLYSEYHDVDHREGTLDTAVRLIAAQIVPEERQNFLDLWNETIQSASDTDRQDPAGLQTRTFSIKTGSGIVPMKLNLTSYRDVSGKLILIAYTE